MTDPLRPHHRFTDAEILIVYHLIGLLLTQRHISCTIYLFILPHKILMRYTQLNGIWVRLAQMRLKTIQKHEIGVNIILKMNNVNTKNGLCTKEQINVNAMDFYWIAPESDYTVPWPLTALTNNKFKSCVRLSLLIDFVEWFNQSQKLMPFNRFVVQCNPILTKSTIHNRWIF